MNGFDTTPTDQFPSNLGRWLWRYASFLSIAIIATIVYAASVSLPVWDCDNGTENSRLCGKPGGALQQYLKLNADFLKKTPQPSLETLEKTPQTSPETPFPHDTSIDSVVTFGNEIDQRIAPSKSAATGDTPKRVATNKIWEAFGVAGSEYATAASKTDLARKDVFGRSYIAWLKLDSSETGARVLWASTLGASFIALILLISSGAATALHALVALRFGHIASALAVAGILVAIVIGTLSTSNLHFLFLESWPSRFVKENLRGDVDFLTGQLTFLGGFGGVILLTGIGLRLVVPLNLSPVFSWPARPSPRADDATKPELAQVARLWLVETLDDVNQAVLIIAATLVLSILYLYALLSWPLALVGGCGESQHLPEVTAACQSVGQMVTGAGLIGSLVLGAIVVPAMAVARGMSKRLAGFAMDKVNNMDDWLKSAGLASTYWGTIGRIVAVLSPLLPSLLTQVSQGLKSIAG